MIYFIYGGAINSNYSIFDHFIEIRLISKSYYGDVVGVIVIKETEIILILVSYLIFGFNNFQQLEILVFCALGQTFLVHNLIPLFSF